MVGKNRPDLYVNSKARIADYFIIWFIIGFYFLNNLIWLRQNNYPAGPDEFNHLTISLRFYRAISSNPLNIFSCLSTPDAIWPPLYHISSAVLDLLAGTSYISSVMINMFYLIILLFSVYFIGLKLFDRNTGVLAVIFLSLYPMVFRYSRFFGTDFALAAMVALSICLLLYSDNFTNKKNSLLFGISIGLGMLTKWSFILFLLGPLTLILSRAFLSKRNPTTYLKQKLSNFSFSLIIGILMSLIWYWPAFFLVVKRIKMFIWGIPFHAGSSFIIKPLELISSYLNDYFTTYLYLLVNEQLSFFFFIIFLITLLLYLLRSKNKLPLILWYVVPYFILSLSFWVEGRYMLPALPAVALISAAGFERIAAKRIRYLSCCTVILLGLAQFFDISYNPNREGRTIPLFRFQRPIYLLYTPMTEHHKYFYGAPLRKNLNIDKVVDSITGDYVYGPLFVGIICDDDATIKMFSQYSNHIIDYYFLKQNIRKDSILGTINLFSVHEMLLFLSKLDRLDFIIFVSKNNSWPEFGDLSKYFNETLKTIKYAQKDKVIFFARGPMPDVDTFFIAEANQRFKEFLANRDKKFIFEKEIKLFNGYSAYLYINNSSKNYLLKKNSLVLSFCKGRIKLFYKNTSLTQGRGLSSSFSYQNKHYDSSQATWEVEKTSDHITAFASWSGLPLKQVWSFSLGDNRLNWDIFLETSYPVELKDFHARLFLKTTYKNWLSLHEKGVLPLVYPWAKYANVELREPTSLIGLSKTATLPAVVFDLKQSRLLTNSVIQSSRVEASSALSFNAPQAKILLPEGNNLVARSEISIFDKPEDISSYIKRRKEEFTIGQGLFKLFFDKGYLGLYYKNTSLTQGRGLSSSLSYQNKHYDSSQATWEVEKTSDHITAFASWSGLPLKQVWSFELINDKEAQCEVYLEGERLKDVLDVDTAKIELSLRPDYRHWLTIEKEGKFRNVQNGGVILKDAATKLLGVLDSRKAALPGFLFILNEPACSLAQLHYCLDNRMLIYWARPNKSNLSSEEPKCTLFKTQIKVVPTNQELKESITEQEIKEKQRKAALENTHSLAKNNTRVFFDTGQGRIYWENQELTSGFGFYTSVLADSFWQDSQNVLWQVEKIDDSTIIAKGRWVELPLSQTWKISLINERLIDWNIELETHEALRIRQTQANIILNENYKGSSLKRVLQAKSGYKLLPHNIKLTLIDNNSLCHQPTVFKATFLNSKSDILGYRGTVGKYLNPGTSKNYFKGKIEIE